MLFQLVHTLVVVCGAAVGYAFSAPDLGAVCAVFFFLGRELAQAEYRWIERYGQGRRANMPWWGPVDRRVWDTHSWFWNLALPICVAAVICRFDLFNA